MKKTTMKKTTMKKCCKNCINARKDETGKYCCNNYIEKGQEKASSFDGLSEEKASEDCGECIAWEEVTEAAAQNETADEVISGVNDPRYLNMAYKRRENRLQEAQSQLHSLEDMQAACRRQANGYKKPIADAKSILERIVFTDIYGFIAMEEEERKANSLPLIEAAEEAKRRANAWKLESVEKLDVKEKDIEKIIVHFSTCGEVAEWIGREWPEKKSGLGGEKIRDRIRDAIIKISGSELNTNEMTQTDATSEEQPVSQESEENDEK